MQSEIPPEILLIGAKQAAAMLGISERTLWTLTNCGEVPVVRIRRRTLYDPNDLRTWVVKQKSLENSTN